MSCAVVCNTHDVILTVLLLIVYIAFFQLANKAEFS
jgi:hypothetical protein